MKRRIKVGSVLLLVVMLASFAAAVQKPAVPSGSFEIGGQDVITASDAGGGYLTTRDIVLIVVIVLALIGLGVLL